MPAEDDLVLAAQQGYVVIEGQSVVVEVGDRVCTAADVEFIGNGHLQAVGFGLIEVDPKSSGVDVAGGISAVVAATHDGEMGGVHGSRTDRKCLTQSEGLHSLRVSGLSGYEDIVGEKKAGA